MKNVALVLGGMVVGGVLALTLTGRVRADAPNRGGVRYQQLCEPVGSVAEANSIAGARGVEGYELVSFTGAAICFKRIAQPDTRRDDVLGY